MIHNKAFVIFVLLCGYAFCQEAVTISPTVDASATIKKNAELTVNLRGNPTTGYSWFLQNANQLDENVIKATNLSQYGSSKDYVTDPHPTGFVGYGGTFVFKFTAVSAADNVTLKFVYKRPWELASGGRTITVTLKITE